MEEAWPLTPLGTGPSGAGLPQGHNDGSGGTIVRRDFTGVGQKKTWQEEGRCRCTITNFNAPNDEVKDCCFQNKTTFWFFLTLI